MSRTGSEEIDNTERNCPVASGPLKGLLQATSRLRVSKIEEGKGEPHYVRGGRFSGFHLIFNVREGIGTAG